MSDEIWTEEGTEGKVMLVVERDTPSMSVKRRLDIQGKLWRPLTVREVESEHPEIFYNAYYIRDAKKILFKGYPVKVMPCD